MRERFTRKGRGFGFVTFKDPSVVEYVLKEEHHVLNKKVDVKRVTPENHTRGKKDGETKHTNLKSSPNFQGLNTKTFVGDLPEITLDEFTKYFEQFSSISDKVIIHNKENNNKSRGFGFITFDSEESMEKVLEKRFHDLKHKKIEVKRAKPEVKKAPEVECSNRGLSYNYNSAFGHEYFDIPRYCEPYYPAYTGPPFPPFPHTYTCNPVYFTSPSFDPIYFCFGPSSRSSNQNQRSYESHANLGICHSSPMFLRTHFCDPVHFTNSSFDPNYFCSGSKGSSNYFCSGSSDSSNNQDHINYKSHTNSANYSSHTRNNTQSASDEYIDPPICKSVEVTIVKGNKSEMNFGDSQVTKMITNCNEEANDNFTKTNGENGNCENVFICKPTQYSVKVSCENSNIAEVGGDDNHVKELKTMISTEIDETDQLPKLMSIVRTDG